MKKVNYTGSSMNPTLKPGDLLFVAPYADRPVRRGDVIAFHQEGRRRLVIHRVVRVSAQGIISRGDNNERDDPWQVQRDLVAGRVVCLLRRKRHLPVCGGIRGRALRLKVRIFKALSALLSPTLRYAYHRLADSGVFRKAAAPFIRTNILVFRKPAGEEVLLFLGRPGRIIGRRPAGRDEWHIRRPFRLFIDETAMNASLGKTRRSEESRDVVQPQREVPNDTMCRGEARCESPDRVQGRIRRLGDSVRS